MKLTKYTPTAALAYYNPGKPHQIIANINLCSSNKLPTNMSGIIAIARKNISLIRSYLLTHGADSNEQKPKKVNT